MVQLLCSHFVLTCFFWELIVECWSWPATLMQQYLYQRIFCAMQEQKVEQFRENHAAKTIQRTWRSHENEKHLRVCSCGKVQCLWLFCMDLLQGNPATNPFALQWSFNPTPLVLVHAFHECSWISLGFHKFCWGFINFTELHEFQWGFLNLICLGFHEFQWGFMSLIWLGFHKFNLEFHEFHWGFHEFHRVPWIWLGFMNFRGVSWMSLGFLNFPGMYAG